MLDWEGNMTLKKDQEAHVVIDELPDDMAMISSMVVSKLENEMIDTHFASVNNDHDNPHPQYQQVPLQADEVTSVLVEVTNMLNDEVLYNRMKE
jgi:phenylpyruvate tautomerase PptA (4-oxalocrotonate tautomerase family)